MLGDSRTGTECERQKPDINKRFSNDGRFMCPCENFALLQCEGVLRFSTSSHFKLWLS